MNQRTLRCFPIVAALALSGCFGGSSTTMTDGGGQTLTVPEGLARSTATPVYTRNADGTLAMLLPEPVNQFAALASMLRRDPGGQNPSTELASGFHVKTVSSDGNNGFRVTYVVGAEEQTIHFEAADYLEGKYHFSKEIDGVEYFLSTYTSSFEGTDKNQGSSEYRYFDINDFGSFDEGTGVVDRNYISYGARTNAASLPAGKATYVGRMRADTHPRNNPSTDHRERMYGSLRLTADFGESTLEGVILGIRVRRQDDDSYLPDTTYFEIRNGRIVDGQFTADMTGVDSNDNAPLDETVRGYEGGVLGEFYGPTAEEVGGVLNAARDDRVMAGMLAGRQLDPNVPRGLTRSTAAPVHAMNTDSLDDLWDSGSQFAPLTSALERDRAANSARAVDNAYVKTIGYGDTDGSTVRVTYVVGGEEQTVLFGPDDYFETGTDDAGSLLWSYSGGFSSSPSYRYFEIDGFSVWGNGKPTMRFYLAHGARTEAASLPAGTASYAGRMSSDTYNQGNPSGGIRNRMRGDLTLTANFDESSIEGMISGIELRRYDEDEHSPLPDTTRFEIGNGHIADGQFTGSLTGVDTNETAPLRESVRGYEGSVLGEFYGPAAEEVGGVFNARRDEDLRVISGVFGGTKEQ